jgi:DNA repair photolyase
MDLPAFQMPAFLAALRRGWIEVPHPFTGQISRVELRGPRVAGIVFWTRRPGALLPHLAELRRAYGDGLRVQATLTGMPRELEPRSPAADESLAALAALARELGPEALTWRCDPLLLSEGTPPSWWRRRFAELAARLEGQVREVVVSWLDLYARSRRNLLPVERQGFRLERPDRARRDELLEELLGIAARRGLPLAACCEPEMLAHPRVRPAACLDGAWFEARAGLLPGALGSQPSRAGCGCCRARDIGVYDSCAFGCRYCYANAAPRAQAPADPWEGKTPQGS